MQYIMYKRGHKDKHIKVYSTAQVSFASKGVIFSHLDWQNVLIQLYVANSAKEFP